MSVGECQLSGNHTPCSYSSFLTHKVHRSHPCPQHVVRFSSMGLSRFLDCPYQLGGASSAGLVREVRLSKGEAVSFQLPGWLAMNCTGPPGWRVMSLLWCELMDGTLPSLPWWVTSWGLLCFEHLAPERWEMCVLHNEFSPWLMFSSRRLSLSIRPHLQLLKPVNGKGTKTPWSSPQWDLHETQGSGWDEASKGKCWPIMRFVFWVCFRGFLLVIGEIAPT